MTDFDFGARRRWLLKAVAVLALPALPMGTLAQIGSRPARLVVGFAAGGNGDVLARGLAEELKELYPGGLIVENRAGAGGRLAVEAVKVSEHDGFTLLYSPSAIFTILPHAIKAGTFQPLNWLTPIAAVSKQDFVVVVNAATGIKSVAELVTAAKVDPVLGAYGTAGTGTPQHLIGYLLSTSARVTLTHVPYKGGAVALQDTLGGHTPICIAAMSEQLASLIGEGKLRAIAVAGSKRSALLPQVPTLQEQGFKNLVVEDWSGVLGPAGMPAATVQQISERILHITGTSGYRAAMARMGQEPLSVGPAAYASRLKEEQQRWAPVVKAAGFSLDS